MYNVSWQKMDTQWILHITRRPISNTAKTMSAALAISEEMLNRIRSTCLVQFEQISRASQNKVLEIALEPSQITRWASESTEAVAKKNQFSSAIVQQASIEVVTCYNKKRRVVRVLKEEILTVPFLVDKRMFRWMKNAHRAIVNQLEEERKTETVPLFEERKGISCYRYALETAGIEIKGVLNREKLMSLLYGPDLQVVDELQEGDLILFLKEGEPAHLGIYREGKVLSKEGDRASKAYRKPLEDLPFEYGDQVLYFRRREKSARDQTSSL